MFEKKLSLLLYFIVFLLLVITSGCSGSLSRSKAAELISKDKNFSEPVILYCCRDRLEDSYNPNSTNLRFLKAMETLGYIDSNRKLTEKGKKAQANWKSDIGNSNSGGNEETFPVPILKKEIVEMTGIVDNQKTGMFTTSTFTWHWTPIGEVGKALNLGLEKDIQEGGASFQKFDDGWRVEQINLPRVTLPNGIE